MDLRYAGYLSRINVDGQYVIAAYGADDLVETFKDNALSALDGAEAIIDTPVVEG